MNEMKYRLPEFEYGTQLLYGLGGWGGESGWRGFGWGEWWWSATRLMGTRALHWGSQWSYIGVVRSFLMANLLECMANLLECMALGLRLSRAMMLKILVWYFTSYRRNWIY